MESMIAFQFVPITSFSLLSFRLLILFTFRSLTDRTFMNIFYFCQFLNLVLCDSFVLIFITKKSSHHVLQQGTANVWRTWQGYRDVLCCFINSNTRLWNTSTFVDCILQKPKRSLWRRHLPVYLINLELRKILLSDLLDALGIAQTASKRFS